MSKGNGGRGEGWGHAGTGGYGGPPRQPPLKGNKESKCPLSRTIAVVLTVLAFVLDPFNRTKKHTEGER